MQKIINLQQLIEKEYFIICTFLTTDQFISYCRERSIKITREQLEQFEKLGIFYPVVRVKIPKIKVKIEYIENGTRYRDLGILKDDEEWNGDLKEEYAHFWFKKDYAESWFEEGILWEPSSRNFQDWKNFYDHEGREFIVSYYSIFQCYTLQEILMMTKLELLAEWWYDYSDKDINKLINQISNWAKDAINSYPKNNLVETAAIVCQVLSNRFFPMTQTDRRTINLSIPSYYNNWDWDEYSRQWDSKSVLGEVSLSIGEIKNLHRKLSFDAKSVDPLEDWYDIVSFVSLEKKRKLKGKALLAQLIYSMEHMLRLFYKELTDEELYHPGENIRRRRDDIDGEGIIASDLKCLEFLTNQYHLNPRPRLILVVEGNGEEEQFPRLSDELFGYNFAKLGIEVVNINGIAGFTGKKGIDKYGALVKFIDYFHNRQTIVFVALDNEGRVENIKNKLVEAKSDYFHRYVTKAEYIHLWEKKTVEFDNFSFNEIAKAMEEINTGDYPFTAKEIEECYLQKGFDCLSRLYKEKTNYDLPKTKLLEILIGYIISNPKDEFDAEGNPIRPISKIIYNILKLASINHQPTCMEAWKKNQESGYFGEVLENKE